VIVPKSRRPSQERERTDDSLRQERLKTDAAAIGDRASVERDADDVVDHAREIADAVLSAARVKADDQWLGTPRLDETPLTLAGERAQADRTLTGERAAADGTLRTHRDARARFLAAALLAERAATDTYLLTERARSDDAIEHRDDFLRMVAHDLRNLLSGIVLNVELLGSAEGHPPSSESAAAAKRMLRSAARMNRLIGDLVDVTSIDAGKLAMAPVRNDAAALVAEATDTFRPAALEKGVALTAELPAGPLHAEFDHDRMLQVFANLIANAIKFTPRGGEIRVRVEDARATLRFCVSDTGVGIPEGMLDAVFERYWQVGKNDRRGQGLGLYISKSIVEAHHGRIWAESATGKGSRFHFTLPTHTSARRGIPARVPARDEARPSRRRERGSERRR
jgi:signal transduction histidine kinase